jgi:hypothetical protein
MRVADENRFGDALRHGDLLPVSRLRVKPTPFLDKFARLLFQTDLERYLKYSIAAASLRLRVTFALTQCILRDYALS